MFGEKNLSFQCPYCCSEIEFVCEVFHGSQQYTEDCEICCQPILIDYQVNDEGEVIEFTVKRENEN